MYAECLACALSAHVKYTKMSKLMELVGKKGDKHISKTQTDLVIIEVRERLVGAPFIYSR